MKGESGDSRHNLIKNNLTKKRMYILQGTQLR